MLIKLRLSGLTGKTVEVREEVNLVAGSARVSPRPTLEVIDKHLGLNFLLDVKWGRLHNQIGPILLILTSPN